tara:strand:+ start:23136 stop:23333 length:198 start_codon:yes stop_codon:yes gene_type:complete
MLFWKIIMIVAKELKLMVRDLKKEGGPLDEDTPNELTQEEISFVVSERLLNLVPKIIELILPIKK